MPDQPLWGQRLLPHVVDDIAFKTPELDFAAVPINENNVADGWKSFNFGQLANAINALARRLDDTFGDVAKSTTIGYVGRNDPIYLVMALAAAKTGRRVLFTSPRNPPEAQTSLINSSNCTGFVYSENFKSLVESWFTGKTMLVGSVEEILECAAAHAYDYARTWDSGRFDDFLVLHTSGSTGIPKPIILRHGNLTILDAYHDVPDFDGRSNWVKGVAEECNNIFLPLPLFHAAGLYMSLSWAIFFGRKIYFPPPSKMVTAQLVEQCIKCAPVEGAFAAPSILEELSADPDAVKLLANLKVVVTGSANLSTDVGNALVQKGVRILNAVASTEHSAYPIFMQDPQDWPYFCIDDQPSGFEWREVEQGVYELFVVRKDKDPGLQSCFYTFPELDEWSTRDLFAKHPTRPNNWIYQGRADNIVTLSNGEKLNPVALEDAVSSHPNVKGVLVVGKNRFQPAMLIEPRTFPKDDTQHLAMLDEIWTQVAKANESTVKHGWIFKAYIGILPEETSFPRSGKGGIQRAKAETDLERDIDELYQGADRAASSDLPSIDTTSHEALIGSVQRIVAAQLQATSMGAADDFFASGMDSLGILMLSRALASQLKSKGLDDVVNARMLYANPTAGQLSAALWEALDGPQETQSSSMSVDDLVEKYSSGLPSGQGSSAAAAAPKTTDLTIILTGSTGSMGSYILDFLNKSKSVTKVFALNRGPETGERQAKSSASRGLSTAFPKTVFLTADLAKENLGLSGADYKSLKESDAILHNQWRVDFNLSLPSFEPQIQGTRHLVDLAASSPSRPRILLVSTVAEVNGYIPTGDKVPEDILPPYELLAEQGYGASKLTASRILHNAQHVSGIDIAVVRVGQIAGPVDREEGVWNPQEWFPSIVLSSAYLGVLPKTLGNVQALDNIAWAPVERQAQLLVDICLSGKSGYFNGVNPRSASYTSTVLPVLAGSLSNAKVVSWTEWIDGVEKSADETRSATAVAKNPAVKLLDFYKSLDLTGEGGVMSLQWATERCCGVSEIWRALEPVKSLWVKTWLRQWHL